VEGIEGEDSKDGGLKWEALILKKRKALGGKEEP
jgi:hypothetical protein